MNLLFFAELRALCCDPRWSVAPLGTSCPGNDSIYIRACSGPGKPGKPGKWKFLQKPGKKPGKPGKWYWTRKIFILKPGKPGK